MDWPKPKWRQYDGNIPRVVFPLPNFVTCRETHPNLWHVSAEGDALWFTGGRAKVCAFEYAQFLAERYETNGDI